MSPQLTAIPVARLLTLQSVIPFQLSPSGTKIFVKNIRLTSKLLRRMFLPKRGTQQAKICEIGLTVQLFQGDNMTIADLAEHRIARLVDELFSTGRYGEPFNNPVTGAGFIYGDDDGDFQIEPQKETARRALLAREHFARVGPPELQPLPLSCSEISDRKYNWAAGASAEFRALAFISSRFADSLRANDWDYKRHPSFDDYVRGVLASKHPDLDSLPSWVRFDFIALHKKYPPRATTWARPRLP